MSHPNAIDLEAFACGDALARVAEHLSGCEACRTFVERAQAVTREPRRPSPVLKGALDDAHRRERTRKIASIGFVATPMAIAAAVLLWMRAPHSPSVAQSAPAAVDTVPEVARSTEPETTFKGGPQLAVIRERGKKQNRFTGSVTVVPGDRLRIEVALDRTQVILGAVLGDDGSYLELLAPSQRSSGTYFSEVSARIDTPHSSGTIVAGTPEAVARARATGKFDQLSTMRVEEGAR